MNDFLLSRPKRLIFSRLEANILSAFQQKTEAFIPELGVETKLPPRKIIEGISRLEDKGFITRKGNRYIKLTEKGLEASRNLQQNSSAIFLR